MVGEVIQALGNEEQKKKYIPKICSGDFPAGAFALTEPGAGSDPAGMTTTAVRDGNDWILNGSKIFITSASAFSARIGSRTASPLADVTLPPLRAISPICLRSGPVKLLKVRRSSGRLAVNISSGRASTHSSTNCHKCG